MNWTKCTDGMPKLVHRDDRLVRIGERIVPAMTTSGNVLVSLKGGGVRIDEAAQVDGSDTIIWCTYGDRVIAWQPLPLPEAE